MKTGILALITAAIVLSGCSASSSTAKKEKNAAAFEQTAAMIETGSYQFAVRSATPSGGKTIQITSLYTLRVKEGNYEAHLPYFGRAYSGGYGESQSVEFNGEPEDLEIARKENKNNISVSFTIKSGADQYTVNLEVGASAYGNLTISNPRKQPISYYGLASGLKD
jgi:hypothetical protein